MPSSSGLRNTSGRSRGRSSPDGKPRSLNTTALRVRVGIVRIDMRAVAETKSMNLVLGEGGDKIRCRIGDALPSVLGLSYS